MEKQKLLLMILTPSIALIFAVVGVVWTCRQALKTDAMPGSCRKEDGEKGADNHTAGR